MDKSKSEDTLDAVWCVDSESSKWYLLDRNTGFVIAEKDDNGNIIEHPKN